MRTAEYPTNSAAVATNSAAALASRHSGIGIGGSPAIVVVYLRNSTVIC